MIDLLPGRDGESLKAWLAAHPQVGVITRDRWPAYIQAATSAAPPGEAGRRPVPPADQRAGGGREDPVPDRPGHPGRTRGGERPAAPRRLSFRVANPKPDTHSTRVLGVLRARNPTAHAALGLAEELMAMVRRTTATPLAGWVERALGSGDRDRAGDPTPPRPRRP